ncbi:MAG: hypothetical protein ACERKZ_13610 [Lachnotalea sp.]
MNTLHAEVFDTYVYTCGITKGQYSYATTESESDSCDDKLSVILMDFRRKRVI